GCAPSGKPAGGGCARNHAQPRPDLGNPEDLCRRPFTNTGRPQPVARAVSRDPVQCSVGQRGKRTLIRAADADLVAGGHRPGHVPLPPLYEPPPLKRAPSDRVAPLPPIPTRRCPTP